MSLLLTQLVALLQEALTLQRAELELRREEHRALRRRGWGPADRMTVREAARWLGVGEEVAEAWLVRRGLLRIWDLGDGVVVRGVVVAELAAATRDGDRRPSQAELDPPTEAHAPVRPRSFRKAG